MSRPINDECSVFRYAEYLYRHIRSLRSTRGDHCGLIRDGLYIRWVDYETKLSECETLSDKQAVAEVFISNLEFDQIMLI